MVTLFTVFSCYFLCESFLIFGHSVTVSGHSLSSVSLVRHSGLVTVCNTTGPTLYSKRTAVLTLRRSPNINTNVIWQLLLVPQLFHLLCLNFTKNFLNESSSVNK